MATKLNSRLYECRVMHHRLTPKRHKFEYRVFSFCLDLDELDSVAERIRFFSRNRFNLYTFRDSDHPRFGAPTLKENIMRYTAERGVDLDGGHVWLVTNPRILGYVFNPVSFYFCFDRAGAPVCAVAEVNNTFRETKLYFVPRETGDTGGDARFRFFGPKHFYVSPFSALDLNFEFKLRVPGDDLRLHVNDFDGDTPVLVSSLVGKRRELTNARLAWLTLKYPFLTLKVILAIHLQALFLYLKNVPFHRKAENPALQRDVLNPHSSIVEKYE